MLLVGLTGGIGAGKSTVARMLERRGAVVIDADILARQALLPGTPGYTKVTEVFGPDIIGPDGDIDRATLAKRVFSDDEARVALESITHPEVFRLLSKSLEDYRDSDRIVLFDAPLIVEAGFQDACDVIVVVISPEEAQLARVMEGRGMTEDAARARLRAQAPTSEKEQVADFVIRNDGTIRELENAIDALWRELTEAARAKGAGG